MPAWDVSLFSLSLSPSSLSLYLDPGDEQGKVCCRKKAFARNTLEKTLNAQLGWIYSAREAFHLLFSSCYHRGPLSSKRRCVQIANRFFTMCMQIQLTRWFNNPTVLCENIWHEMHIDLYRPGGLSRHMLLFKHQCHFTSKQKYVFLLWTRSHHRRHLQPNTWQFSYKC